MLAPSPTLSLLASLKQVVALVFNMRLLRSSVLEEGKRGGKGQWGRVSVAFHAYAQHMALWHCGTVAPWHMTFPAARFASINIPGAAIVYRRARPLSKVTEGGNGGDCCQRRVEANAHT